MTTIINTPRGQEDSSGLGIIVGILILIVIGFLFFVYAIPAMRGAMNSGANTDREIDVNVTLPAGGGDTSQDATNNPQ